MLSDLQFSIVSIALFFTAYVVALLCADFVVVVVAEVVS